MSKARMFAVIGILLGALLFAAVALFGIKNDPSELPSALIGKPFPEFSTGSLDDASTVITRKDLLGRAALVNVWATWCPSCKHEHPVLNDLAKQGVVIHGINYKDESPAAQLWLKDFLNPYQLNISDPKGTLGFELGVYGAPETFMIDKQGVIRHKFVGAISKQIWREKLAPIYQELVDQ